MVICLQLPTVLLCLPFPLLLKTADSQMACFPMQNRVPLPEKNITGEHFSAFLPFSHPLPLTNSRFSSRSINKIIIRTSRIINYHDSGLSKSFKQQLEADNEQQVALELTPKAQVLEGGRKFRVLKIAFPGVFNRYFPLWMPCCSVRIHARRGTLCH